MEHPKTEKFPFGIFLRKPYNYQWLDLYQNIFKEVVSQIDKNDSFFKSCNRIIFIHFKEKTLKNYSSNSLKGIIDLQETFWKEFHYWWIETCNEQGEKPSFENPIELKLPFAKNYNKALNNLQKDNFENISLDNFDLILEEIKKLENENQGEDYKRVLELFKYYLHFILSFFSKSILSGNKEGAYSTLKILEKYIQEILIDGIFDPNKKKIFIIQKYNPLTTLIFEKPTDNIKSFFEGKSEKSTLEYMKKNIKFSENLKEKRDIHNILFINLLYNHFENLYFVLNRVLLTWASQAKFPENNFATDILLKVLKLVDTIDKNRLPNAMIREESLYAEKLKELENKLKESENKLERDEDRKFRIEIDLILGFLRYAQLRKIREILLLSIDDPNYEFWLEDDFFAEHLEFQLNEKLKTLQRIEEEISSKKIPYYLKIYHKILKSDELDEQDELYRQKNVKKQKKSITFTKSRKFLLEDIKKTQEDLTKLYEQVKKVRDERIQKASISKDKLLEIAKNKSEDFDRIIKDFPLSELKTRFLSNSNNFEKKNIQKKIFQRVYLLNQDWIISINLLIIFLLD